MGSVTSVSYPNLTTVIYNILLNPGSLVLNSINFPVLKTVGFGQGGNTEITLQEFDGTSIAFPVMTYCEALYFSDSPNLITFSAPKLTTLNGTIDGDSSPLLQSVDLSSLTTFNALGPDLEFSSCPSLTTVLIPNAVFSFTNSANLIFTGCALNAASVNLILRRAVVSGCSGSNVDIELSGGTNAAPTGQGILDKATLISAGCTVNTN
jgi:hypothetical protein